MQIQTGDVFKVGPHTLACGDLELGHAAKLLELTRGADVAYVDPPWNQALASNFRRMAGLVGKPDFAAVLRRCFEAVALVGQGEAWLEMGDQNQQYVEGWGRQVGFEQFESFVAPYAGHTSWITRMRRQPGEPLDGVDLSKASGLALPVWALARYPAGTVVFDPCLGLGATLQACCRTGNVCVGMELNAARLAESIEKAVKKTGAQPAHIGRIA